MPCIPARPVPQPQLLAGHKCLSCQRMFPPKILCPTSSRGKCMTFGLIVHTADHTYNILLELEYRHSDRHSDSTQITAAQQHATITYSSNTTSQAEQQAARCSARAKQAKQQQNWQQKEHNQTCVGVRDTRCMSNTHHPLTHPNPAAQTPAG